MVGEVVQGHEHEVKQNDRKHWNLPTLGQDDTGEWWVVHL